MRLQHVTEKNNAQKIKKEGFSLEFSGKKGGNLLGDAIYLSKAAAYWEHKIGFKNPVVIDVEVDMNRILTNPDRNDLISFFQAEGYMDENRNSTAKIETIPVYDKYTQDWIGYLKAEYAKSKGYGGIVQDSEYDNVMIWDCDIIECKGEN